MVAYTIAVYDDPEMDIYNDAYGLEMNIDSKLSLDTVLIAPCELVHQITDSTAVTSMGTVYAGTCGQLSDMDTTGNSSLRWHLVELETSEDCDVANQELVNATKLGLSVIMKSSSLEFLSGIKIPATSELAFVSPTSDIETVRKTAELAQSLAPDSLIRILVIGKAGQLYAYNSLQAIGADGVFVANATFDDMLETINSVAG